jgi:hypothetical protein
LEETLTKKILYIGKLNNQLENIINSNRRKYTIILRIEEEKNITDLYQNKLKNLDQVNILIIDLSNIIHSSSEAEIKNVLDRIRKLYPDLRIILILKGATKGNMIFASAFSMGIYNLINGFTDNEMSDQLELALSDKGMNYGQSSHYIVDNLSALKKTPGKIIETRYEKIKQDVLIAVAGLTDHIGTTTWSINLLNFFNQLPSIKSCYIEANKNNDIKALIEDEKTQHLEKSKMIQFKGMDFYYDMNKIADIKAKEYNFLIYDYGSIEKMDINDFNSFLNADFKFLVCGNSIFEEKYMFKFFEKIAGQKLNKFYFIYNFVSEEDKTKVKDDMKYFELYFNEYQPNMFELKSKMFLENIFREYITTTDITEEKKNKIDIINIFKKFKKQ